MPPGLHCCDNLELLGRLKPSTIDLVYIDPPFKTGRQRRTTTDADPQYPDRWPGGMTQYLDFLVPRLEAIHGLLKDTGTLYVHLDWRTCHYVKVALDQAFGEAQFLNQIIWHYRTGGVAKHWFGRKHDTLLVYAKQLGQHTFHVQRGGAFRTDGLRTDEHGRPFKTTTSGRLYFNPEGPALTDVWDLPFLSTVAHERAGYPGQKPLALLERIILASSNPGDLVADFFCGSGTTLVAARRLGRKWLGCDSSPAALEIAAERLAAPLDPDSDGSSSPHRTSRATH